MATMTDVTSTSSSSSSSSTVSTSSFMARCEEAAVPSEVSTHASPAISTSQNQTLPFDIAYKLGMVYVFPPIQTPKVNIFRHTDIETPLDPLLPYSTPGYAMEVDEVRLASSQDKLKGEEAEASVVRLLNQQLQLATSPGDSPVFLFSSLMLLNNEKDIVVFHRKYGVIIVEVKGVENPRSLDRLRKGANQLLEARDAIRAQLQGLLAPDAVNMLMALPNLTDPGNARQNLQILHDNPDIQLLYGREATHYAAWLQQLPTWPDPLVWEARPDSHQAFITAVTRHLSVEPCSPSQAASELAQVHRSWLLSPIQAEILHCRDSLLHIWGPPGAGKTLLLLNRVRLWLAEGRNVIVAVGDPVHSVLLEHLGRTALRGGVAGEANRLTLCRSGSKFQPTLEELGQQVPFDNVCVVIDEVDEYFLPPAFEAIRRQKTSCLWTASVTDIPETKSAEYAGLGGRPVRLPHTIRCPPHVVEVAQNLLEVTPQTPTMAVFPCLPARLPTASVKATLHPCHQDYRSLPRDSPRFHCQTCSHWLKSSLSPLVEGLPLQDGIWRHWVIVGTGDAGSDGPVSSALVEWLRGQGVPAVWEKPEWERSNLPVSSVQEESHDQSSAVRQHIATWRARVVSGTDVDGRPAVHVVWAPYFQGMEKASVLLVHYDRADEDHARQSQSQREERTRRHRDEMFRATTRCQAELAVWLVSPSPAARCLAQLSQDAVEAVERRILNAATPTPAPPAAAPTAPAAAPADERRRHQRGWRLCQLV